MAFPVTPIHHRISIRSGEYWLDTSYPVFTPVVNRGDGWQLLCDPQEHVHRACMLLAAHIWTSTPDICLEDLRAETQRAFCTLREGAQTVTLWDDAHRIERTELVFDAPVGWRFVKAWQRPSP